MSSAALDCDGLAVVTSLLVLMDRVQLARVLLRRSKCRLLHQDGTRVHGARCQRVVVTNLSTLLLAEFLGAMDCGHWLTEVAALVVLLEKRLNRRLISESGLLALANG